MKYLIGLGLLVVCVISGLLGMTVGINMNPGSTTKYVLNWGSLGDWVAGAGAFFAVGVALRQSFTQSQKDRIRTLIIDKSAQRSWSLRIVSEGLIPVTVLGAEIHLKELRYKLPLSVTERLNVRFPQRLERGDVQQLIEVDDDNFEEFAKGLVSPIVVSLQDKGVSPRDYNYGVNEEYFAVLESYRIGKAKLVIRLAHDDITHELAPTLIADFFSSIIAKQRANAEQDAREKKERDGAFFAELQKNVSKE